MLPKPHPQQGRHNSWKKCITWVPSAINPPPVIASSSLTPQVASRLEGVAARTSREGLVTLLSPLLGKNLVVPIPWITLLFCLPSFHDFRARILCRSLYGFLIYDSWWPRGNSCIPSHYDTVIFVLRSTLITSFSLKYLFKIPIHLQTGYIGG